MMFKFYFTRTRPNIEVEFFKPDEEYRKYFFINYIKTGKFMSIEERTSDDNLTVEGEITWKSIEDYLDFLTDPVCRQKNLNPSKIYNQENNIQTDMREI